MTLPAATFVSLLRTTRNPRAFNEILDAYPMWAVSLPADQAAALVELYLQQNAHTRNRLLGMALEATSNPALADALLSRRPASDPLPWRSWFVRQNARDWDELAALPKAEWLRPDRTGSDALSVYIAHVSTWHQLDEGVPRLVQLVAAGACLDGTVEKPGNPLRMAAILGSCALVEALVDAGASVNLEGACSPLMALACHWSHERWLPSVWHAPHALPSASDWTALSTTPSSASPAERKAYRRLHGMVGCWNLLVAAGADPHAFDATRAATPLQKLEHAFPEWGALWRAHELDNPKSADACAVPSRKRF